MSFLLLILLSFSVWAADGSVYLSPKADFSTGVVHLSFLSNRNENLMIKEISLVHQKKKTVFIKDITINAFSDSEQTIALPTSIKPESLYEWKLSSSEADLKIESWHMILPQAGTSIPKAWKLLSDKLTIPAGIYEIKENFALEQTLEIVFEKGVILKMGANVSLYFKGSITANDLQVLPLTEKPWGSFILNGYGKKSSWTHVTMERGSEGFFHNTYHTGSFAIYGGTHHFDHLTLRDFRGEDALNIKDGVVVMTQTSIVKTTSDAFDCDFCKLEVKDSFFSDIQGDAVDLSGSDAFVHHNIMTKITDKGISLGEGTKADAAFNKISQSAIGIAVKDSSVATIHDNTFEKNGVNVSLYIKKPFWSAPKIIGTK